MYVNEGAIMKYEAYSKEPRFEVIDAILFFGQKGQGGKISLSQMDSEASFHLNNFIKLFKWKRHLNVISDIYLKQIFSDDVLNLLKIK